MQEFGILHTFSEISTLSRNEWNNMVKKAALKIEVVNIKTGIDNSSKLALYNIREENISLDISTYLRGIMTPGKRLKFKLRSGTHALGNELKRWSARNTDGNCKCCDADKLENVTHFVAECSKFIDDRKQFLNDLLHLLPTGDVKDRFLIQNCFHDDLKLLKFVLSDNFGFLNFNLEKIHEITHAFLYKIYLIRNKLIFSTTKTISPLDCNVGSGANDYVTAEH